MGISTPKVPKPPPPPKPPPSLGSPNVLMAGSFLKYTARNAGFQGTTGNLKLPPPITGASALRSR